MQEALVTEKVKQDIQTQKAIENKLKGNDEVRYTATIDLTNSKKIGFSRRDLALCFFPKQVVEKADRTYEQLSIDGTVVPFDNPRLLRRFLEIVQKKYLYNGTVRKRTGYSFQWYKIAKKLCKLYNLKSFVALPERHRTVTALQITPNTDDFNQHVETVTTIIQKMKTAPHLTLNWDPKKCFLMMACPRTTVTGPHLGE